MEMIRGAFAAEDYAIHVSFLFVLIVVVNVWAETVYRSVNRKDFYEKN